MKIENYLHLYLGCNVLVKSTSSINGDILPGLTIKGIFKLVAVGLTNQTVNVKLDGYIVTPNDMLKPVLRPLSSITEEEATHCGWMGLFTLEHFAEKKLYKPASVVYLLSKCFDVFDLIEGDLAIAGNAG